MEEQDELQYVDTARKGTGGGGKSFMKYDVWALLMANTEVQTDFCSLCHMVHLIAP